MKRALSLIALLSLPAFAQGAPAPAPAPAAGDAAAPPAGGTATTSTQKGSGTKKEKPVAPDAGTPAATK